VLLFGGRVTSPRAVFDREAIFYADD